MHILCLILICLLPYSVQGQSLIVGTFNLRYNNSADTGNLWADRAPVVAGLIRFHQFDILGTQEGLESQLNDMTAALPEYARYGVGRDDGKEAGEHAALFFRKERFTLEDKGDFWLSETPHKPSKGWDATCCKRICSWVKLHDRLSAKDVWVFNAHYDHQGVRAREESSRLILKQIKAIAGDGMVLFMGDLNGGHASTWYKSIAASALLKDTYTLAAHPYAHNPTFQAFGRQLQGNEIIDHIFISGHFTVSRWGILSDSYHGRYPSDHFPVLAGLTYK